jgi:hypothetical protein
MFKVQTAVTFVAVCVLLAPLGCSAADDSTSDNSVTSEDVTSESSMLRALPELSSPTLAVPDGNRLAFYFDATGVQIYTCQAAATGFAWTFQAPEALLFDRRGRAVIDHYAGPTWESLKDGSSVVATKVAGFTPDPSAIPELLLQASAHIGKGRLSRVTFIQRLETTGGLAPTTGCDAEHIGASARVDYTATYYFYEAKPEHCN